MNAQTAIRAVEPQSVVTLATLNFLKPMQERLLAYQYEPPAGVPQRNGEDEPHLVAIADARPLAAGLSLDAEGFELLQAPSAFAAFDDPDAIRAAYYAEVEELLAEVTGAQKVIAFDHNVRSMARAAGGEPGIRGPVPRTHNDFTARSGPERAASTTRVSNPASTYRVEPDACTVKHAACSARMASWSSNRRCATWRSWKPGIRMKARTTCMVSFWDRT